MINKKTNEKLNVEFSCHKNFDINKKICYY